MWERGRANRAGIRSFLWLPVSRPCSQHWPKQGRKMGKDEPVRAALSCGLGSSQLPKT